MSDFRIFYIHKVTKIVVNLAELRLMNDTDEVVVEKTLYDDVLSRRYDYINSYTKSQIMNCFDWDIVPITEGMTKKDLDNYNTNKEWVKATEKYKYIGYEIKYFNKDRQHERSFY